MVVAGCSEAPHIAPDPSGTGCASSGSGQVGDGSCDLCASTDGSRVVRMQQIKATPDGMKHVVDNGYWDTKWNEPCFEKNDEYGTPRCFPNGLTVASSRFQDSSCTQRLAFRGKAYCGDTQPPLPLLATSQGISPDPCIQNFAEAYELGAMFTGQIYELNGNVCVPFVPSSPPEGYSLGQKIPAIEFTEMTTVHVH